MSKTDGKYDETDPKIQKKLAFLEDLNTKTADRLTSWQDMYDQLRGLATHYMAEPSKAHADLTITMFTSFLIAMEQLPEEGDIVVIARRMNEILVLREDLTGASVFVGEDAEQQRASQALLQLALVAGLAASLEGDSSAPAATSTGTPPVLH